MSAVSLQSVFGTLTFLNNVSFFVLKFRCFFIHTSSKCALNSVICLKCCLFGTVHHGDFKSLFFWKHCSLLICQAVSLQSGFGTLTFLYNVPFSFLKFGVSSFIFLQGVSFLSFGWNVSILVHFIMVIYIVILLFPFFLQHGSFSCNMSTISCNLNLTLVLW